MAAAKPTASAAPKARVIVGKAQPPPTYREKLEAYGRWPVLTFLIALVMPVLSVFAATGVLVHMQMDQLATELDKHENTRTTVTIHGAFDSFLSALAQSTADEATWDEAYLNVVVNNDSGWMDSTWGETARLGLSYDTTMVTDQAGNLLFGEGIDGSLRGTLGENFPAAPTMLERLDKQIETMGDVTVVSNYAQDSKGLVALAAMSIHRSADAPPVPAEKRRIFWLARHINTEVLRDFAERYQIPLAHLTDSPGSRESSIMVEDASGQPITRVAWVSDQPGSEAAAKARLTANVALGIIGGIAASILVIIGALTLRKSARVERRFTEVVEVVEQKTAEIEKVVESQAKAAAAATGETTNKAEGVFANSFEVVYAPIFDLRAERMVGAEALLRWKAQDGSPLLQEDLTSHELNVLLQRLGILGVRRVLEEVQRLPDLPITVAVPAMMLANSLFVEKLGGTLAVTHFSPERLRLAVDVSLAPPISLLAPQFEDVRNRSITLMLDQFMLGPATLAYAQAGLTRDVRLHRELVDAPDGDMARNALSNATFSYASSAGLLLSAANITVREQAARLLRLGCQHFSGNLIAEPMPIGSLTQLALMPARRKAG